MHTPDKWYAVGNTVYFDKVKPAVERINYIIVMGDHGKIAHLISAVPEMYDSLAWLINERDKGTDKGLLPDGLLIKAREALSKAEGKQIKMSIRKR
jgi:hypothetical protein